MKKKTFILLEVIAPLIFLFSWLLWNIAIRNYSFVEASRISVDLTFLLYIILNIIVAFNYKKIEEESL